VRVVADSNIFVSAMRFGGKPAEFVIAAESRRFTLVVSEQILLELADVFSRKFHWSEDRVASSLGRVRAIATVTSPSLKLSACVDPDDDRILEAAVDGRADFIVSGDKHLLRMKTFQGIEILKVGEFLLWNAPERSEESR
jgi:putative PIN family toxin of toxin-antitoxin system